MVLIEKKYTKEHLKRQHEIYLKKQRKFVHDWYLRNKSWYVKYRRENPEKVREWRERYRKSRKGQAAIKRYEQSPHRRALKNLWSFVNRQETKFKLGEISEYQMHKRISRYKEVRGLK